MKNTLKTASFYLLLIVWIVIASFIETYAAPVSKRDAKTVKTYVHRTYGRCLAISIAPAEQTPDSVIENRMGTGVVYVDQFVTRSKGRYGVVTTKGPFKGRRIRYENRHKRGKTVILYLIYNPNSNYSDDVVAFVEGGKLINKAFY